MVVPFRSPVRARAESVTRRYRKFPTTGPETSPARCPNPACNQVLVPLSVEHSTCCECGEEFTAPTYLEFNAEKRA